MKLGKFIWSTLRIAVMVLGLSGCVAALSTPLTVIPLTVISLILLISVVPASHSLRDWWEYLIIALLVQVTLFSTMIIGAAISSLEKVKKRLDRRQDILNVVRAGEKRPFLWPTIKKALPQQSLIWLVVILPPAYLLIVLNLWRQGQQTLAIIVLLPPILLYTFLFIFLPIRTSRQKQKKKS